MKIYYTPFENSLNAYSDRMKHILTNYGEVKRISKRELFRKIYMLDFSDIIIVNWFENIIITKDGKISYLGVVKAFFVFIMFRLFFKKFIYVRHNHYPHSCSKVYSNRAKKIINTLEKISHYTLVHSPTEVNDYRIYIPHPLYNLNFSSRENLINNKFVIFGGISRYKKIHDVIRALPDNYYLVIMGKCSDQNYLKELRLLIQNRPNIELISDYVSDEKAREVLSRCEALLITHNDEDMIVSGSFFYAMSIKVKVFALSTPFFDWAYERLGGEYIQVFDSIDNIFSEKKIFIENINNITPYDLFSDQAILSELNEVICS